MIEVWCEGTKCGISRRELLTAGSRGIMARFTLAGELAALDVVTCWRAGRTRVEVPIAGTGAVVEVPADVLATPGDVVEVGAYGAGPHRLIPTVWAELGTVRSGTGDWR